MGAAAPVIAAIGAGLGAASSIASTAYTMSKGRPAQTINLESALGGLLNLPAMNTSPKFDAGGYNLGHMADKFTQFNKPAVLANLAPDMMGPIPNLGAAPETFSTPQFDYSQMKTRGFNDFPSLNLNEGGGLWQ